MLQQGTKSKKSHVHCDFNTNDEEGWDAPAWCNAHSLYPEDDETTIYSGDDVREMSFTGARLILAEFGGVDGRAVDFSSAVLSGADFTSADLRSAIFKDADLCKATLRSADLSGANLSGSDLMMATLAGANLVGANLSGCCLDDADLDGALFNETTELPFGEEEAVRRGMHKDGHEHRTKGGGIYE